jgi:uncharacterized phage protein (TIGR01671 family)
MGDKMRKIKFRAWDNKLNGWTDKLAELIGDKGVDELYEHDEWWMKAVYRYGFCDHNDPGRLTWEQFTGIVDKNGKEIYEGDIIEYQIFGFDGTEKTYKAFITWIGQGFYSNSEMPRGNTNGAIVHGCVVIGNIHENKELIK